MPGRGHDQEYLMNAAKVAKKLIDDQFQDSSDIVKSAVVSSVFRAYTDNIVPSYILETEGY